MPTQVTKVLLDRTFLTDGAYIPDPPNTLYYTTGTSSEITTGTYAGLYSVGGLTESSFSQLYNIPPSGRQANTSEIMDYSVTEDATSLDPASFSGGSGQLTVTVGEYEDIEEFLSANLELQDSLNGVAVGTVRGISQAWGTSILTADNLTALLNVYKELPSYTTLRSAVNGYIAATGINIAVTFEDGLDNLSAPIPAYSGSVWDGLKQIASALQFEIGFRGRNMVVRLPRKYMVSSDREVSLESNLSVQEVSKKVRVYYYGNVYTTKAEIYPIPEQPAERRLADENYTPEEPAVYSVDAYEKVTYTVPVQASLISVNQPQVVEFVENRSYAGSNGVYSVVGNDSLPITPAQWRAEGGSLTVKVLPNKREIEITIQGPNNTALAPYRIAMSSGNGSDYNSLHITGTGLIRTENFVDLVTGATDLTTTDEIGQEVTNPFISTLAQAYTAGFQTAATKTRFSGVTAEGYTFRPGSLTFGSVAGARLRTKNNIYRILTATTGPTTTSVTAEQDVLMSDFNKHYAGMTIDEFNAQWQVRTLSDFSNSPVKALT